MFTKQLTVVLVLIAVAAAQRYMTQVKLVGGRGEWGIVCDDNWKIRAATVVCNQLGYGRVKAVTTGNFFNTSLKDKIFLDDTLCVGYENNLGMCRHRGWLKHNCKPREAAGVECDYDGAAAVTRSNTKPTTTTTATTTTPTTTPTTTTPTTTPTTTASTTTSAPVTSYTMLPDLIPNITSLVESVRIKDLYLAYLTCAMEENCLSSSAYELKETRRGD
ncbi:hypothetical protein EB796_003024 [Bugula neritina]|uniref:SRCR domain-containing protein n=1 Tax=Bugula neritina TaxID=10212 RepID=A0A7J7KJ98_BUGNE|nr:hypothetical protein EB796_003024 [Bugula neritina]